MEGLCPESFGRKHLIKNFDRRVSKVNTETGMTRGDVVLVAILKRSIKGCSPISMIAS
jgi:hypothetical protein